MYVQTTNKEEKETKFVANKVTGKHFFVIAIELP